MTRGAIEGLAGVAAANLLEIMLALYLGSDLLLSHDGEQRRVGVKQNARGSLSEAHHVGNPSRDSIALVCKYVDIKEVFLKFDLLVLSRGSVLLK